jgi:hypothetical protein
MRRLVRRAAVIAVVLSPSSVAIAQPQPERGAFVVLLGSDTIAVERYERTGSRVEGTALNRSPQTVFRHWIAELDPRGTATKFVYHAQRLNGSAPPTEVEMTFGAGTVESRIRAGGRDTTLRMPAANALPFVYGMFSHYELALRHAALAGGDPVVIPMIAVGAPESTPLTVRRVGADSMTFDVYEPAAFRVRVDGDGRILGVDGLATTAKVTVRRVDDVDIAALSATWAKRDSAGAAMGTLSPLDSVKASAGAAEVAVVYSRPSLRGRQLMGLLVPYDQVWRTGANAATILRTSRDLEIGGVHVPAGSYSLWSVHTRDGAQLVINRQTGQWGTEHDASQDLARVPMTIARATGLQERFTFALTPAANGGTLAYAWGDLTWSVPFVVRP